MLGSLFHRGCCRDGRILSAINEPNEYGGPGSGYRVSDERRSEIVAIRDVLTRAEVLRSGASDAALAAQQFLAERAPVLARIEELQKRALASDRPSALAAVTKALQRLRSR